MYAYYEDIIYVPEVYQEIREQLQRKQTSRSVVNKLVHLGTIHMPMAQPFVCRHRESVNLKQSRVRTKQES